MPLGKVQLFVAEADDEAARGAAADVAEVIGANGRATVMFAVGESPVALYGELAERRRRGDIETSGLRAIQLDEYVGIPPDDQRSFFGWLGREVLGPLVIPSDRVLQLRGDAADLGAECARYERAVEALGGIDLAILGLGTNGHLGFNEPPSGPDAATRVVELTPASIASNARYWGGRERVPPKAITAGMRVLLAARATILVVSGAHKSGILRAALLGPVTPDVPASYLRTIDGVRVYADRASWEGLPQAQ